MSRIINSFLVWRCEHGKPVVFSLFKETVKVFYGERKHEKREEVFKKILCSQRKSCT